MMKRAKNLSRGVIGIDEVGRGPLAGPITVCAFYIEDEKEVRKSIFENTIRDSKKLKKDNRLNIYKIIRKKRKLKSRIEYALSSRSAKHIDMHGIAASTQACVVSCLSQLEKKGVSVANALIRLDAGLKTGQQSLQEKSFVKGDERFTEIALASIMAKVQRDGYMKKLSKMHTEYGWERNAGYGTKEHRDAIKNLGITEYHRKSYLKNFQPFVKTK